MSIRAIFGPEKSKLWVFFGPENPNLANFIPYLPTIQTFLGLEWEILTFFGAWD